MSSRLSTRWFANRYLLSLVMVVMVGLFAGCNLGVQHHNVLGKQAFEAGQFASAVNEFQLAINANPQNADPYYNLAATFFAAGKTGQEPAVVGSGRTAFIGKRFR